MLAGWFLTVKEAKGVPLQPDFAIGAQLFGTVSIVLFQGAEVAGAALFAADAIQL